MAARAPDARRRRPSASPPIPLRTTQAPGFIGGVTLSRSGKKYEFACTQNHYTMEGRELVRSATLAEYTQRPDFAEGGVATSQKAGRNALMTYTMPREV